MIIDQFKTALAAMFVISMAATAQKAAASDTQPTLSIKFNNSVREFKRDDLLSLKSSQEIVISNDPSYPGQNMKYKAVPARELFKDLEIPSDAIIQFVCLDGFSAPLSLGRLLSSSAQSSTPYIAIEPASKKWPPLKGKGSQSAGPFYLVWLNPELSKVGPEEWPFQLASFEIQPALEKQFSKIAPGHEVSATSAVALGYQLFVKNCFACHTMNGQGNSKLGPDLNIPFSPTEYLGEEFFVKLIRSPQSLRRWPESKMSSFSKEVLSDQNIEDIRAYLKYMAKHKAP